MQLNVTGKSGCNVVNRQVRGRHGRAGSKLLFLLNTLMYFHIVCSARLSVRTHAFHVCKRGSIPLPSTIIAPLAQSGLRRRPVTAEITGSNPVRCAKFMLSWMSGLNQHPAKVSPVVIWAVGSNPTLNAKYYVSVAERPIASDCKSEKPSVQI
jgi:hypothetical protein